MKNITILDLVNILNLKLLNNPTNTSQLIKHEDYFRPGLQFAGFYKALQNNKVQVIGTHESDYLYSLCEIDRKKSIKAYVESGPLCIVITESLDIYKEFIDVCVVEDIPLLLTDKTTFEFTSKLSNVLEKALAQEQGIHAVCMNVFGVGVLIRGESGIGKSEVALSLIEKGHRLIADDLVILNKIGPDALIGKHNNLNKDFLALRGIGLVNVLRLYGTGAIQEETKINIDIELCNWDKERFYDAVYSSHDYVNYMGIDVQHIQIPIRSGRDISTLIEVATKNWRLQQNGYNATQEFEKRIKDEFNQNNE